MDINKNSYTVVFASIMVIIVAAALAYAAIGLKPFQDSNIVLEKKQNILSSVGITIDRENAEAKYSEYIKSEIVLNNKGEEVEGSAFDIDLSKEMKKDVNTQLLPLFISQIDGATSYIIPLRGKGLWGPIWGFIALKDDLTTVYGAVFDHKGETPGLGAEINQPFFQEPFAGKTIFEGLNFTSIKVVKVGYSKGDMHAVDGISGGTITSDGVTDMLSERLSMYLAYFEKIKAKSEVEQVMVQINSLAVINN
ncbi:MAG: NADH:ubiquinone reductase (Na(+)-transporting) subunit C [Bacteroidetes bacterium]|jgi:Na+-transporting NADH:ubiquinone oxidoreductase subunit C|nr:MAG: NADH-quinone reductase [Cryomorphaceae bacterium BACL11 MAG-121001-bin54]KRO64825.1 MAG: NADH-quinone reductase [Cryomorphaceae bacterium BACL11 MAG-121015-bin20]KRO70711.1 MAG: NADH-quinone reductase [Cryomorphaceae bacterium BACL11 MAG-121128-bin16]MDA0681841.1 NADH:ubiquinone reductase (Na(+)-transporting) subunit C [Bacteroidota bacterium]MDA0889985.1 NADH:ubiquinone reductase (Na(+)-transporting) subunit C [Bacteroidota bacterium]